MKTPVVLQGWPAWAVALAVLAYTSFAGLTGLPVASNWPMLPAFMGAGIAILLVAVVYLAAAALTGRASLAPAPVLLAPWLAVVLALVALPRSAYPHDTLVAALVLLDVVVLVTLLASAPLSPGRAAAVLAALVALAAAVAGAGLAQFAAGLPTPEHWVGSAYAGVIRTRVYATLGNPNVLAGYLLPALAASALLVVLTRSRWLAVAGTAAFAVIALALWLTYSRAGYLGAAACVAALAVAFRREFAARRPHVAAAAIALAAGALLPAVGLRVSGIGGLAEDTAVSRVFIWRTVLAAWRDHWLGGIGPGALNTVYSARRPPDVWQSYALVQIPGSAHNEYLQWLVEFGLAGAALLAAALIWSVLESRRAAAAGPDPSAASWWKAWAAAAAGLALFSLLQTSISVFAVGLFFAAVSALAAGRVLPPRPFTLGPGRRLAAALAAVLLVAAVAAHARLWMANAAFQRAAAEARELRFPEAAAGFARAVRLDPLDAAYHAYLGDLAADLARRRVTTILGPPDRLEDLARDLYLRARRLSPYDPYPPARLGALLLRRRPAEAASVLRQAVHLDPYDSAALILLGTALRRSGAPDESVRALRRAGKVLALELDVAVRRGDAARQEEIRRQMRRAEELQRRVRSGP